MDRAIIVLCVGRCGSSLVSGILHRLNITMAVRLDGCGLANPKGYYEDVVLRNLNESVIRNKKPNVSATFREYIEQRRQKTLWGIKDPRLTLTFEAIEPLLDDYRILIPIRSDGEMLQSFEKNCNPKSPIIQLAGANFVQHIAAQQRRIAEILERYRAQYKTVCFTDLLSDPQHSIENIRDFAYEGLMDLGKPDINEALKFVDPNLYRCKEKI